MNIGFTGTRRGMMPKQLASVNHILIGYCVEDKPPVRVHHGDCVGADSQFHDLATDLGLYICVHPPINESLRAGRSGNHVYPTKDYLARNRDIVDEADAMIAAPSSEHIKRGGGTWWTIGVAILARKPIYIVDHNGNIRENGTH